MGHLCTQSTEGELMLPSPQQAGPATLARLRRIKFLCEEKCPLSAHFLRYTQDQRKENQAIKMATEDLAIDGLATEHRRLVGSRDEMEKFIKERDSDKKALSTNEH